MDTADSTSSTPAVSTDSVKSGKSIAASLWLPAVLLLYTLCVFVPWNISLPPNDLDASWNVVLQWAHVHKIDFGKNLIFTYGPWGFVNLRYMPALFGWAVLTWSVLAVGFFLAAWKIAGGLPSRKWAAGFMLLFITLAGGPVRQFQDVRIAMIGWLLLLIYFYFDDSPWEAGKIILTIGLAWVGLIKTSTFSTAVPVLGVITIDQVLRKRIPSFLICYIGSFIALWLLAGQPLGSLGAYLSHSLTVVSGYTEGLQQFVASEDTDVLAFVIAVSMLFAMLGMMHPWYRYRSERSLRRVIDETLVAAPNRGGTVEHGKSILGAMGFAAALFAIFKTGYVRHDIHEIIATASLGLIALAIGATVWPRVDEPLAKAFIAVACVGILGLAWYSEESCLGKSEAELALGTVGIVPNSIATAIDWLSGGEGIRLDYEKQKLPLPDGLAKEIVGPVDSYSIGQRVLIDNNLDYRPRPVFQSYYTYSAELSRLNAEFLAGASAPETVLFRLQPIDEHYPSQDDALSIPELLTRYDLKDAARTQLVLRRSQSPRSFSLVPLGERAGVLRIGSTFRIRTIRCGSQFTST